MSKISVGFSTIANGASAVAEAVEAALGQLEGKPNLAILPSTVDYNVEKVVAAVQEKLADVPLWGGTSSAGIISPTGLVSGEQGALGIMLISGIQAGVGSAELGDDPQAAGLKAAKDAIEQIEGFDTLRTQPKGSPDVLLMMSAPGNEEAVMEGIKQVSKGIPIMGGSSADNTLEGNWRQFANGEILSNGVTVAALSGVKIGHVFSGAYEPTGKKAKITKIDGRTLIELDNQPALSVYSKWLGKPESELREAILIESVTAPVARQIGDFYQVAHPADATGSGEIGIFVNYSEGDELELLGANIDELITGVKSVVSQAAKRVEKPAGVLLVHCAGRNMAIGERMNEVSSQIEDAAGDVPAIGLLAFGEQGTIETGESYHANLMLSALVLGE
ncbi:TPA: hypothetical protein EYP66_16675 [Candidatus Poribacteria bacterium]|nr:hypothetical protein [Candidatus Poribacteria bacterium]